MKTTKPVKKANIQRLHKYVGDIYGKLNQLYNMVQTINVITKDVIIAMEILMTKGVITQEEINAKRTELAEKQKAVVEKTSEVGISENVPVEATPDGQASS